MERNSSFRFHIPTYDEIRRQITNANNPPKEKSKSVGNRHEKNKVSTFLVTINLNSSAKNLTRTEYEDVSQKFGKVVLRDIFSLGNLRRVVDEVIIPGYNETTKKNIIQSIDMTQENEARYIHYINSEGGLEVGPKYFKLHAHIVVSILHNTRVTINKKKLSNLVEELMNEGGKEYTKGVFSHTRFIQNSVFNSISYATKQKRSTINDEEVKQDVRNQLDYILNKA